MSIVKPFSKLIMSSAFVFAVPFISVTAHAVEVDVAVVYDDDTKDYYEGSTSTAIIAMVDQANTYLANSNVDIQLNLVATQNINVDGDLSTFRKNAEVSALRESSGADFMTLISNSFSPGCGVGYVTTNDAYAFNVIKRSCMSRSYVHEMGHTMGLGHSLIQESTGSQYDWGIGYGVENVFSTAMAYESAYNTSSRTYLFSNPDYQCKGYDCGIDKVADAAAALNNVKNIVASHRDSIVSTSIVSTSETSLESGSVSVAQSGSDAWNSISFKSSFSSVPVVVMGPATKNGNSAITMNIRNVTTDGFEFQLDEWDYLNGTHPVETIAWLAVAEGEHNLGGMKIYAGKASYVQEYWRTISFENLSTTPVLLAQKEVSDNDSASTVRIRNVSENGAELFLQEEEANDGNVERSTVHYLAIEPGTGDIGELYLEAGITENSITESWSGIQLAGDYNNSRLLAAIQTYNGIDPIALRYQSLSSSSFDVMLQEEQSADTELGHASESVGWLIIGEK